MFTGIISAIGRVVNTGNTKRGGFITVKIDPKIVHRVPEGGSVSIDGVCLTRLPTRHPERSEGSRENKDGILRSPRGSLRMTEHFLFFELMDSTLKRTTLGARKVGDCVNIEPALVVGQPFGGHFVSGHVDGVGVIKNAKCKMKNGTLLTVKVPNRLARYIVPQGSITVNGVSLTVVEVTRSYKRLQEVTRGYRGTFSVALTQYTAKHTNLGMLKAGDKVNIETDMFAKYIFKFLNLSSRGRAARGRGDLTGLPRRLRAPRNDGVYEISHRRGKI